MPLIPDGLPSLIGPVPIHRYGVTALVGLVLAGGCHVPQSPTSGSLIRDACGGGSCCVPVGLDATLTKAYLVAGKLYIDVGARGTSSIGGSEAWASDAEVTTEDGQVQMCKALFALTAVDEGPSFAACPTIASAGITCGSNITIKVRLTSWAFSLAAPDYRTTCETIGFEGAGASLRVPVACPTCPAHPSAGDVCDYPRTAACDELGVDVGTPTTSGCSCGPPSSTDRRWSCSLSYGTRSLAPKTDDEISPE